MGVRYVKGRWWRDGMECGKGRERAYETIRDPWQNLVKPIDGSSNT